MKKQNPVLKIAPFHLSMKNAEKHVSALLKATGFTRPKAGWHSATYNLDTPAGSRTLIWKDMIDEVRRTGGVSSIQNLIDSKEPIFGGSFGMAVSSSSMSISNTFLGQKKTFKGPARNYPVEQEFVGDILAYRKLCCEFSKPGDFSETSRFFRAYLFACISLIDAFLNRYVHIATFNGKSNNLIDQLKQPTRLDQRLSLWLQAFGLNGDSDLKKGKKWNDFLVLKKARNLHVHATEPYLGYEIKGMINPLNACREGIGGLITFLQKEAGNKSISLFQKLTTAPIIKFSEK